MDLVPEIFRVEKKNEEEIVPWSIKFTYVPDHITIKISFRTPRPYKVKCTTDMHKYILIL